MGSLILPPGPDAHSSLCVPSKSGICFSPSPVEVLQTNPTRLQSLILWDSSSHCRTSRLGSLMWGSEPSLLWMDFCGIIVLKFVSHPPSSFGIWFYCDCTTPTISLWLLLCLWMWGVFFGEFQCLPVNDCYDSSAVTKGSLFPIYFWYN